VVGQGKRVLRTTHRRSGLFASAAAVVLVDGVRDEERVGPGRRPRGRRQHMSWAPGSSKSIYARITKGIDAKADGCPHAGAAEQTDDRCVALDAERVNREEIGGQGGRSREGERDQSEQCLEEGVCMQRAGCQRSAVRHEGQERPHSLGSSARPLCRVDGRGHQRRACSPCRSGPRCRRRRGRSCSSARARRQP
jgi:hypothetical protein